MIVYWSMIIYTFYIGLISQCSKKKITVNGKQEYRTKLFFAFLIFGYIIFWVGIRSGYVDTAAYIRAFEEMPIGGQIEINEYINNIPKDKGFYYLSVLFKNYISSNYHHWLFSIAAISGLCIMRTLRKYSVDFPLSVYLFISTGIFTWMMNGIRQFLVVSILFAFCDLLIEKKFWKYTLITICLYPIHSSVLIILPFIFLLKIEKPWCKRMMLFIILVIIGIIFSEKLTDVFLSTVGQQYTETFSNNGGSSYLRTIVSSVPCMIGFIYRKKIEKYDNLFINLCLKMSIFTTCLYMISSFTNGILVGRVPIYFSIYNLILLPWEIRYCFEKKERKIIYILCIVFYLIYFYYDMKVVGPSYYKSDLTGLIN